MNNEKTISVKINGVTIWMTQGELDEYRREANRVNLLIDARNKKIVAATKKREELHVIERKHWYFIRPTCSCGAHPLWSYRLDKWRCPQNKGEVTRPRLTTEQIIEDNCILAENVDVPIGTVDNIIQKN